MIGSTKHEDMPFICKALSYSVSGSLSVKIEPGGT